MKTLLKTIALLILVANSAWAQGEDDTRPNQDPSVRERIQAARAAYITEQLTLTTDEAEKFWPVYREYSDKRRVLYKELRAARRNPAADKTTEENEKALMELDFKIKQQQLDLEKEYTDKFLKVIPTHKVRMLPEVERKFKLLILDQIQQRRQGRSDYIPRGQH